MTNAIPGSDAVLQQEADHAFNKKLKAELQHRIDHKTKPPGSLGLLEHLALQMGFVLKTISPRLEHPQLVVFAADHGIAAEGVSAYPAEVTAQMVLNFVRGGAAINVFCRQHGMALSVVDAGVKYDFDAALPVLNQKIAEGTQSFLHGPAMTQAQMKECLLLGAGVVKKLAAQGCNTLGLGEMGIGNTSSAAVLMSLLCGLPLEACVGRGTGVSDQQFVHKQQILQQAVDRYTGERDVASVMAWFGGFEIVQMTGAFVEAYWQNMLVLVDGFIASVAFLCAYRLEPAVRQNAVFCHQSHEQAHSRLLALMDARPLLQLDMRLGEGTGCALALPLLQSAVLFLHEMASFEEAGVRNKEE